MFLRSTIVTSRETSQHSGVLGMGTAPSIIYMYVDVSGCDGQYCDTSPSSWTLLLLCYTHTRYSSPLLLLPLSHCQLWLWNSLHTVHHTTHTPTWDRPMSPSSLALAAGWFWGTTPYRQRHEPFSQPYPYYSLLTTLHLDF